MVKEAINTWLAEGEEVQSQSSCLIYGSQLKKFKIPSPFGPSRGYFTETAHIATFQRASSQPE